LRKDLAEICAQNAENCAGRCLMLFEKGSERPIRCQKCSTALRNVVGNYKNKAVTSVPKTLNIFLSIF